MANPRQKRKARSSTTRTRPTPNRTAAQRGLTKRGKKKVDFLGNPIIAANWDRAETLVRNYRRMGLVGKLGKRAGGGERRSGDLVGREDRAAGKKGKGKREEVEVGEVRVERDAQGSILRILGGGDGDLDLEMGESEGEADEGDFSIAARERRYARLHASLRADDGFSTSTSTSPSSSRSASPEPEHAQQTTTSPPPPASSEPSIPALLEAQAQQELATLLRTRRPRQASAQEAAWMAKLVGKYGENYAGMARDRRLNPMQQSAGDLKMRAKRWRETAKTGEEQTV